MTPRFSQQAAFCVKCGGVGRPKHTAGLPAGGPVPDSHPCLSGQCGPGGEHLHWTCQHCGFVWVTLCKDAA